MVTQKNFSMKNVIIFLFQAAKLAGISYSTAKKIFTSFRMNLKISITKKISEEQVQENGPRAAFRDMSEREIRPFTICCLIGGVSQQA